jgi:CRP/FNR family cyclic AMP-dependent transcriptional regulator
MISRELLKQQSLFQDLPEKALAVLQPQVRLQEFQRRDFVLHKGGAGDALVLLLTGRLQVFSVSESGKEVGISFIEPGDHFGEISLIDGGPRSASVMAVTNSTVGFVPKATALQLFHNEPSVAARIQARLCAVIRSEIQHRAGLAGHRAYARVYSVLANDPRLNARGHRSQSALPLGPIVLTELPNQSMIASMANVSRETVSRALSQLAKDGVIRKERGRISVLQTEQLLKLAADELPVPADENPAAFSNGPARRSPGPRVVRLGAPKKID